VDNEPNIQVRDYSKTIRVNGDGTVDIGPEARRQAAEAAPAVDFGSGMTIGHSTPPSKWTRSTVIKVGGMECSVGVAEDLGYIFKDSSGRWVAGDGSAASSASAPTNGTPEAPQSPDADPVPDNLKEPEVEPLQDEAAEADMALAIKASRGATIHAMNEVLQGDGTISDATIGELATNAGIEPSEARDRAERVQEAFYGQAVNAAARVLGSGEEGAAFMAWAAKHARGQLVEAGTRHFTMGTTDGYRPLMTEYVASLGQSRPDAILATTPPHGFSFFPHHTTGQVMVRTANGAEMTWATAIRSGILPFGRK
jgi:hypothetical protein